MQMVSGFGGKKFLMNPTYNIQEVDRLITLCMETNDMETLVILNEVIWDEAKMYCRVHMRVIVEAIIYAINFITSQEHE